LKMQPQNSSAHPRSLARIGPRGNNYVPLFISVRVAKQHLKPGGILQAWLPGGVPLLTGQAVLRSLAESFPHVRCFDSLDSWGTHLLASMDPIEKLSPEELAKRLPAGAKKDLLEWAPGQDAAAYLALILAQETPIDNVLNPNPSIQITDDHPFNEYFLLRQCRL